LIRKSSRAAVRSRRGVFLLIPLAAFSLAWAGSLTAVDEASYPRLIASHEGKVVLVNFWATWCGPCRDEMPALAKLAGKLRDRDFVLVTVSADESDQEAEAAGFLRESGVHGEAYIRSTRDDEKFVRVVNRDWSGALPASVLYDRSGKKLRTFEGEVDFGTLERAIESALS